ncbi:MAG: ACP S-malonyltransferase [Pleomorphochaeta sp.]
MEKVVMCFPGQGSQKPNMAIDLFQYSSKVKELFQLASDISKLDLFKILTEGDVSKLKETEVSQNAIILASLSSYYLIKDKGFTPIACAGFSLGELMAIRACEMIDNETLFKLVHKRSSLMAKYSNKAIEKHGEMAMAAIINMNKASVENVIKSTDLSNVFVANNNSEKQVVISGLKKEISEVTPLLKENGARRVIPLKVSGPFHTPLLNMAEKEFSEYLNKIEFKNSEIKIYSNVTGTPVDNIKDYVPKQITNKVLWLEIMKDIKTNYSEDKIIEVGVSTTLSNFFKSEDIKCIPCGTLEQIKGL